MQHERGEFRILPEANEVWVSSELVEQLLAADGRTRPPYRVLRGPQPEAKLVDAYWRKGVVVLVYDRAVAEPSLESVHTPSEEKDQP